MTVFNKGDIGWNICTWIKIERIHMYLKVRNVKKFTSKEELDSIVGKPELQLEN